MPQDTQTLIDAIDALKNNGASDDFIVALLRQNGWSEKRIYQAFHAWYEIRIGQTLPSGGGRMEAARDAFLYLIAFITLGIWAVQLGALLFGLIDRAFPNPATDYSNTGIDFSTANQLASILVAFPLFLLVTRQIVRKVQREPERLESPVRKWLTYLALVISAVTMLCDVVTFLAFFLRGDLDARFICKVLTVFVIAGGIFAYYVDSVNREHVSRARSRAFAVAALIAVLFGLGAGFFRFGSPASQQMASQDTRRLSDLSALAEAVHARWKAFGASAFHLPASIHDLASDPAVQNASIFDPVTHDIYGYSPIGPTTYNLCGDFSLPAPLAVPAQWRHPAGGHCFSLDARQDVTFVYRYSR